MPYHVNLNDPCVYIASPSKEEHEIAAIAKSAGITNDGASLDAYFAGITTVAQLKAAVKILFRARYDFKGPPPGV